MFTSRVRRPVCYRSVPIRRSVSDVLLLCCWGATAGRSGSGLRQLTKIGLPNYIRSPIIRGNLIKTLRHPCTADYI